MKSHVWPILIALVTLAACDVQQESPLSSPSEYYDQGVQYFHRGAYRQAEVSFARAISLLPQNSDFINISELYSYLGRTSLELGEYRSALNNLENAKQHSARLNDYRLEAQICSWQGDVYSEMREYSDAVKNYRESMRLSSALNDVVTRAQTSLLMASALTAEGILDQAANLYSDAFTTLENTGKNAEIADALGGMGEIYRLQKRYPEAANSISQALGILGTNGDPLAQAKLKMSLGLIHKAQSDPNGAIGEFRDAVNILRVRQTGKAYEGLLLFNIGTIYEENGRLNDARRYYSDALEINRSIGDRIAENYLYLFIIRCNLGLMSADQRAQVVDKLLQSYQQIAARFHECGHRSGEAYVYTLIGSIFEGENNLPMARSMFQKAVDLDLETRGEYLDRDLHLPFLADLGIANDRPQWYDKLAFVLLQMNLPYDAAAVLDLSQTRAAVRAFDHLDVTLRHPQVTNAVKDCRAKLNSIEVLEMELSNMLSGKQKNVDSRQIADLQSQLADLRKYVRDEASRIVATYPNYEPLLVPVVKKSQELQKSVPDGSVVLQFLLSDHELDLLAMTRQRLTVERVRIRKDSLLSMVHEYEQLLQDPGVYAGAGGVASLGSMTEFERLSTRLYDCFIRPIDKELDRSVVVVARNEFGDLPFQALERQDSKGNVRYLIELSSVDYLPSLSSLQYGTVSTTDIKKIIACGNPSGQNWAVDYELRDIRSFFKSATVMLGIDATWKNLLGSTGDVLQLSTDFTNTTDRYDLGTFVCASGATIGETENIPFEHLTAHEPYPVIELSNQQVKGEGLTPFQALLLRMNGTSDVFLNAWLADRKASKFFSEYFYTNLAAGLAPGDAYRQALLNLIGTREVSHPHSWGQFFHFGVG